MSLVNINQGDSPHEEDCDCSLSDEESDEEIREIKLKTKGIKRRKKVLDEDVYVDQIEKIIERDFFPDLAKHKQRSEKPSLEPEIRVIPQRESVPSPATFETPVHQTSIAEDLQVVAVNNDDPQEKNNQKEEPANMNLDQFFNKYTSEDNASFAQLQEQELRKHKIKYKWLHKDGHKHNKMVKQMLELPTIEKQAIGDIGEYGQNAAPITWPYVNHNSVMFNPIGVPLSDYKNSSKPEVIHSNTRFESNPFNEAVNQMTISLAAQLASRQKEGKIGIDGKEIVGKDTPQVNGFKFVASTPTPAPELYDESPLMTWGEIAATPMSLGSETPIHPGMTPGASHFKIPDLPEREKVGLTLQTRVAKLHRDRKKHAMQTVKSAISSPFQSSRTSLERLNSMSPAAQLLAKAKLGVHRNVDCTLMASYSPMRSPMRSPGLTPKSPRTPLTQ